MAILASHKGIKTNHKKGKGGFRIELIKTICYPCRLGSEILCCKNCNLAFHYQYQYPIPQIDVALFNYFVIIIGFLQNFSALGFHKPQFKYGYENIDFASSTKNIYFEHTLHIAGIFLKQDFGTLYVCNNRN